MRQRHEVPFNYRTTQGRPTVLRSVPEERELTHATIHNDTQTVTGWCRFSADAIARIWGDLEKPVVSRGSTLRRSTFGWFLGATPTLGHLHINSRFLSIAFDKPQPLTQFFSLYELTGIVCRRVVHTC